MNYIFIVGCARTGSKLHADILGNHARINLVDELHFLAPRWIRRDFRQCYRRHGPLRDDASIKGLIDEMYSDTLNGTFWSTSSGPKAPGSPNRISDIPRDRIEARMRASSRELRDIFRILIEEHARVMNKDIAGAKFPVDLNFVPQLYKWFPHAKFIHLIRDPRAILASMVAYEVKHASRKPTMLRRGHYLAKRFLFAVNRYRRAANVHREFRDAPDYFLSRFEDMMLFPERQVAALSNFLDV